MMNNPKYVSVVIPNLNSPHIGLTVESVLAQKQDSYQIEIIVVGLDEPGLIPLHDRVRFISTDHPVGAAQARNMGAKAAQGNILCFIDADCFAHSDWLEQLTRHVSQRYPAVGGGIEFNEGNYWTLCDNISALLPFLVIMPAGERPYLPTLNFAIRRDVFFSVNGFDEGFPGAAGEDPDLCFRLRVLGHKLYFVPEADVYHRHPRASARSTWRHIFRFGEVWIPLRKRFQQLLGHSIRTEVAQRMPHAFLLISPFAVIYETFKSFLQTPQLWRYWYTIPGILWCKQAWYAGAAQAMLKQNREQ